MRRHLWETDYYVAKHGDNMRWVHVFLQTIVIWITIGNIETSKIEKFSRIMTVGGGQGQNQNYQMNQIDQNFFLTTMTPPSAVPLTTTAAIGITVDETIMLTTPPPPLSTPATVFTESLTTTAQSKKVTDLPIVTDQITSETQGETIATVATTLSNPVVNSLTTISDHEPTISTVSSTLLTTNRATASTTLGSTSTTPNIAPTVSSMMTATTNTLSTVQISETTTEIDILDTTLPPDTAEFDNSDVIVFPDEDNTVSEKYVTFPPLIYQLMSSQRERVGYGPLGIIFPSEIKIYLNFSNPTIVVPGIIQENTNAQGNKTTAKEVSNKDSFDKYPHGREELTGKCNNKPTSSTETPVRNACNEETSGENTSGEKAPNRENSNSVAASIQTLDNDALKKQMHDEKIPNNERPPITETLGTTPITDITLTPNKEAQDDEVASTQTQSTRLVTGILTVLTSSTETTTTPTELQININGFVDILEENIDLSDKTRNSDFGQKTDQFVGQTPIHRLKCDEYNSFFRNSRNIPKEKNSLPFQLFIVGGVSSEEKEFPHMAALGYGNGEEKQWLCGGSLISEKFVLTAAHCLSSKEIGEVQIIRLGTTTLQTETLESVDYGIFRKIPHPLYVIGQQYNDIALIELDRIVKFTEYILPICLDDENDYTGRKLIAIGWGRLQATGSVSKDLQKVDLDYFSHEVCQQKYSKVSEQDLPRGIDRQTQICVGSETENKDSCQGDSGGPLEEKRLGRDYLVGITSFGIGCGTPGIPGVYTRVSYYIPWIESIVWPSSG